MKGLLVVVALVGLAAAPSFAQGPTTSCDGAPAGSVLAVPDPFARFVRVVCGEHGHALAPVPGQAWILPGAAPFVVPAFDEAAGSPPRGRPYFSSLVVERPSPEQSHGVAALIRDTFLVAAHVPLVVARLSAETSTGGRVAFHLAFAMERPADGGPERVARSWGASCRPDCVPFVVMARATPLR